MMVRLVSTILRDVNGKRVKPGEEFEVDHRTAAVLVEGGGAEAIKAAAAKDAAAAPDPAKVDAAKADATKIDATKVDAVKTAPAAPKAATEVKPVSTADGPNQGEYATRDLKAKG